MLRSELNRSESARRSLLISISLGPAERSTTVRVLDVGVVDLCPVLVCRNNFTVLANYDMTRPGLPLVW